MPHLFLTDCVEAIKSSLSSGNPMVALACRRCSRQYLDLVDYSNQRDSTHLCIGCDHKLDVAQQIQGNPLAALGY